MHRKRNCWEAKHCGRQPGGHSAQRKGVCPAANETRLHGVHDGENGGRACWVVADTTCHGLVQGSYSDKYPECTECSFYKEVRKEQQGDFLLAATLLARINGRKAQS